MNINKISVFGSTGFIGSRFCEMYKNNIITIPRNEYITKSNEILYFISTIDNYNIHTNLHTHIDPTSTDNVSIQIPAQLRQCSNKSLNF